MTASPTWFGQREQFDYDVFISYRSIDGRRAAEWLSQGLRSYRVPGGFQRPVARLRVYRDVELELVTPAIWEQRIRPALTRSRFLLLVLTPSVLDLLESEQPNWVMREVREFLQLPQSENVLLARAGGSDGMQSLPEIAERFPEPGWADIRPAAHSWARIFRRASLGDKLTALAAPMLEIRDDEIPVFNGLARREKRRRACVTVGVSIGLLGLVSTLAMLGIIQRDKANSRALAAEAEQRLARDQVSAFEEALHGWTIWKTEEAHLALVHTFPELVWTHSEQIEPFTRTYPITDICYAPDGQRVVTAGEDGTARVWDVATGEVLATLKGREDWFSRLPNGGLAFYGHPHVLHRAVFSPDGKLIVSAGEDGWRLWNPTTGEVVAPHGSSEEALNAAFSPDGRRFVTANEDATAQIWDSASHKVLVTVRHTPLIMGEFAPEVLDAEFSVDGQRILTKGDDETVRVWNSSSGEAIFNLRAEGIGTRAEFSPDGRLIVGSGAWRENSQVWNAATGKPITGIAGLIAPGRSVFSSDSQRIITMSGDSAQIWNATSGKLLVSLLGHTDAVNDASFSPDGRWVVTASDDRTARVWNADNGQVMAILQGNAGKVTRAVFSPDGLGILTGTSEGAVQIWTMAIGQVLAKLEGKGIIGAAFSPDSKLMVTYSKDGTARIWNAIKGRSILALRHAKAVRDASFSPDGREVFTISDTFRVWNRGSGRLQAVLNDTDATLLARVSPDGLRVVSVGDGDVATIWNTTNGQAEVTLRRDSPINDASFSSDSKSVMTASRDRTVRLWDAVTGKMNLEASAPDDDEISEGRGLSAPVFSPDDGRIAAVGEWNTAYVWDAATGHLIFRLKTAGRWVYDVVFSPDGKRILTNIKDDTYTHVQLWTMSGEEVNSVGGNTAGGHGGVFSRDARWFVTAGDGGAIRVWKTANGQLVANLQIESGPTAPQVNASFSPDGQRIVTAGDGDAAQVWRVVTLNELDAILHE